MTAPRKQSDAAVIQLCIDRCRAAKDGRGSWQAERACAVALGQRGCQFGGCSAAGWGVAEGCGMNAPATTGYPVTKRSLARLRELVAEAGAIAESVRASGPVDVRFEAACLLTGIGEVDGLLHDLTIALAMVEAT